MTDLQHIDDPHASVPETRSLDAIRRDLSDLERRSDAALTADLDLVRHKVHRSLGNVEQGGDAWRAIITESESVLDEQERLALAFLDAARARLLADRTALAAVPFRSGLSPSETREAEVRAERIQQRLPQLDAVAVHEELSAALLFAESEELAAWALSWRALEARFPLDTRVTALNGQKVYPGTLFGDLLAQCEAKTGDRRVIETRDRIEGQVHRLNELTGTLTQARAAHNPAGGVGGPLVSFQFGRAHEVAKVAAERKFDPDAVARRLGTVA